MSINNPLIITIEPEESPRRQRAIAEAAKHGLAPRFVMSIPKDDPRITEIHDVNMNRRWRKHMMAPSEVSCYCGHRLVWKRIIQENLRFQLVLEDDFEIISFGALHNLNRLAGQLDGWDIIMLFKFNPKGRFRIIATDGFELRDYQYGPTSTVGYLITQAGAKKMLARERIFRPIDEDFINPWELGLRVLAVSPDIVKEYNRQDSGIEAERSSRESNLARSILGLILKARWQVLSRYYWKRRPPIMTNSYSGSHDQR